MGELVVAKLILIFILCCSSMQHSHSLTGNATDRLALLAIKASMTDSNGALSSWNETVHFCLWDGVTCSKRHRQRVTELNLESLALMGSISPSVGNLSFLKVLNLRNNSFTHHIPPQIGNLRRLQVLRLNNNSLDGTIPANISNCLQLRTFNLGKNNLVGKIPSELSSLSNLEFFIVQFNNLTGGIPPSLGNLSSLDGLALTSNNFRGSVPSSLCQLKKLTLLFLGVNRLSGIFPSCIYNLSGIVKFYLLGNQFQGSLPSNLGDAFPNLRVFSISNNLFSGVIPLSISNATSLESFYVGGNSLTGQLPNLRKLHNLMIFSIENNHLGSGKNGDLGFVSELINATQLSWLQFGGNKFGGTLPTSVSNLSNLEVLLLPSNQLRGSIPTGLGNLVNLQSLYLRDNSFTGNIPTDIGKASRLVELGLQNNKLSGSIPSSLGNLSSLAILYLQGNKLNDTIPLSLGECHALLEIDISQNNLEGTIPQQLLSGIYISYYLNFSQNHLSGSFPMEIGKLKNLGVLDASNNLLSGELPSSLSNCESLEGLYLQSNSFTGPIPSSMKELKGIRELDLSRNNFSGDIPKFLEGFRNLESLDLSFNRLVGEVPTRGVFRNASTIAIVGNTGICGGIAELELPVCKPTSSKREGLSRKMKIVISLVSAFSLLGNAVILYFFFLRKKKKEIAAKTLGNSMLQVSYAALRKATDGFSPSNLIGTGAFASVYRGILEDDRVVVAVKVFNMLQRGASKSFMAECEALRNIRHRNLVKIITACSSIDILGNDFKALVYDFMDNGSLEEWLHPSIRTTEEVTEAPKVLTLVQRLDIAIDVAYALDYLHNNCETPIVHCDLKPSNVLLDKEMTGHVSDFGLAKFLSMPTDDVSGNQSTSTGIRGTVGYASPEYGMGSEISTNGDIYSFGILLLEMFTGKRPTEPMFSDGFNLHNFVKMALPKRVLEIADALVLQEDIKNVAEASNQASVRGQKVKECLTLIFGIGIACSVESPTNRKDIGEAVAELKSIRDNLLS